MVASELLVDGIRQDTPPAGAPDAPTPSPSPPTNLRAGPLAPRRGRVEAAARAALGHDGYEEYAHEQYEYEVDTSGPAAVRELARLTLGG
ncbi:hypothetical protein [Streptomyces sp. BF23-19]|uniref:hypothetical protein n=1 Tax=Streptomyces TaxID=1883 RepID=UPI0034E57F02|nr:hypothetical protein OG253_19925 [Streptomyces virginiae]